MEFKPLGDKVLIDYEVEKKEKTEGGIILTDYAKERPQQGKVVAVGPGYKSSTGVRHKMSVKVGDIVKFKAFAGHEVKVENKEYFLMPEHEIQGIIDYDEGNG